MKMRRELLSALFLSMLAGCGSDDSPIAPDIPETPEPEKSKYLTMDIVPKAEFTGTFTVDLGVYPDPIKRWFLSGTAKDLDGNGFVDEKDAALAGIINEDPGNTITVHAAEMDRVLKTNPDGLGAGSARSDIFVSGHYSAFDVLRYLVATRDDLRFDDIVSYKDSGRDTFEYRISWDCNGDGEFSDTDNENSEPENGDRIKGSIYDCGINYSNLDSPDWHFQFLFGGGDFTRAMTSLGGFSPTGESNYERMDQFWIQSGVTLRFQSFSPEMTERRQWVQDREMARLVENGGKVIVPELTLFASEDTNRVIRNLEVTPHNMRPDIFQPDVLTKMDVFLSAADAGTDIAYTYWESLSTGAEIGHFSLFRTLGVAAEGATGWNTYNGEKAIENDFSPFAQCDFSSGANGNQDLIVDRKTCQQDWAFLFGGDHLHIMSDVWVMNQPVEYVKASIGSHYPIWGMPEYNGKEIAERDFSSEQDGSDIMTLQVFPLPEDDDRLVLQPSHFGWGVADCTECHNADKAPQGHGGYSWPINSSDGFDEAQPYYCATCHGSNGAPLAHGDSARCFWCHSGETNRPSHHGDASTKRLYKGEQLQGNTHTNNHPLANGVPKDKMSNALEYTEIWSSANSDWDMSKVFPDPYSCMTCHKDKELKQQE